MPRTDKTATQVAQEVQQAVNEETAQNDQSDELGETSMIDTGIHPTHPSDDSINSIDNDNDDDDIPESFNEPGSASNGDSPSRNSEANASDLAGFSIDADESAKDREMLSAPTGDYTKRGRAKWQFDYDFNAEDKQKGDKSKKGRLIIKFAGAVENDEWKGMTSFRLSPDKRFGFDTQTKQIDRNKYDGMFRLWCIAEEYFILRTGEAPANVQEVVDLIAKDDEIIFRIVKGREIGSGSFVMGFKAANS